MLNDLKNNAEENKEEGASLVEYALLVALIAVVAIIAIQVLGQRASQRFSQITRTI